jgi:hypothetical protein
VVASGMWGLHGHCMLPCGLQFACQPLCVLNTAVSRCKLLLCSPAGAAKERQQTTQQKQQTAGSGQAAADVAPLSVATNIAPGRQAGAPRGSGLAPSAAAGGSGSSGSAVVRVAINLAPPPPQQIGPSRGE